MTIDRWNLHFLPKCLEFNSWNIGFTQLHWNPDYRKGFPGVFKGLSPQEKPGKMAALIVVPVAVPVGSLNSSMRGRALQTSSSAPRSVPIARLSIRCARVGGIEIPNAKRIETSLQYIHGVGVTTARQVLLDTGLENKLTRELSEEDLTRLREEISKYMIEGDLRRFNAMAIKRLKDIQCYRGKRHIMNLPCRGQHTKCNARTRKGKKVAVQGKQKSKR